MHAVALLPPRRRLPVPQRASAPVASLALVSAIALLGACSSVPKAEADADRTADLAGYRTFSFARPLAADANAQPSALTQHMEQATLREMRSRGLRQTSAQPQLIINFNANTRQAAPPVPTPPRLVPGGYYAYRDGQYTVWPGYRDRNATAPYPAGTINIDIVDAASKQLVWEAVVPGAIQPGPSEALQPAVDAAVKAAFANYPKPPASAGM
jgi:Domain of unknown function (DUF4136)